MKIIWKIYFWVYTAFSFLGVVYILLGKSSISFSNRILVDIIAVAVAILSLYSYVYKKPIFRKRKYWVLSLLIVFSNAIIQYRSFEILSTVPGLLTILIGEVPIFYVLFKILFDKHFPLLKS